MVEPKPSEYTGHVSEKTKAKAASAKRKYLHYMTYQLDAKLECLL